MKADTKSTGDVTFLPASKNIASENGRTLLKLAQLSNVSIYNTCSGVGTCGKCLVKVNGPLTEVTKVERRFLSEEQLAQDMRLACQCHALGDVTVEVPVHEKPHILSQGLRITVPPKPNIVKDLVDLPPPSVNDQTDDLARIRRALGMNEHSRSVELGLLKLLPKAIRSDDFFVTAVHASAKIIAVEPGDTRNKLYGVAFDIGTTTVVGYLHDLESGNQLEVASDLNPQVDYGADVISRIEYTMNEPSGAARLQKAVVTRLNSLIDILAVKAKIRTSDIYEVTLAGNTTMLHLALGLDASNIAKAPYIPVVRQGLELMADKIGLHAHPQARLYTLPHIASYVGADIVGDLLASRLYLKKKPTLLLDIGTNGEIVLGSKGRVVAASSAAGPCFEGGNINAGMRASEGAIAKVKFENGQLLYEVIGQSKPRGLCGTGLIDLVAEMIKVALIDETGRLLPADQSECEIPSLLERVRQGEKGQEFLIVPESESATGADIILTQRDIRELQNAKAAVYGGILVLCKVYGIKVEDINEILLAGAFGNYISRESAITIGLIPNLPLKRIKSIGNAAGVGSAMALISVRERHRAERLAHRVDYVELSSNPDFRDEYMDAMYFPV